MKGDSNGRQTQGFVKLMRSPFTLEVLRDPLAFGLLTIIAMRARRRERGFDGLEIGEALIGDHHAYGLKRQQYRTRCTKLEKAGLVKFRKTNRGTIAKLVSNDVFDINEATEWPKNQPAEQPSNLPAKTSAEQPRVQPSRNQRKTSQQPLMKKEEREKNEKNVVDAGTQAALRQIATAAADDEKFVKELKPHFPENRVPHEYTRFLKHCRDKGRTATREGFVDWMLRARPECRPLPRKIDIRPVKPSPPEPVEPEVLERFMQNYKTYKAKHEAQSSINTKP